MLKIFLLIILFLRFRMENTEYEVSDLKESDLKNGYIDCLRELKNGGIEEDEKKLSEWYKRVQNLGTYTIKVIRDPKADNKVIAIATLLIDYKIYRGYRLKGHIEDVCVIESSQGNGLGKLIVEKLIKIAKDKGCYKISLACKDTEKLLNFYEKGLKLKKNGVEMTYYFE